MIPDSMYNNGPRSVVSKALLVVKCFVLENSVLVLQNFAIDSKPTR